jgi:hypothetical protein
VDTAVFPYFLQSAVEPMQVDAPPEDNDNNEEEPYIVENPSLVSVVSNFLLNLDVKRKRMLLKILFFF